MDGEEDKAVTKDKPSDDDEDEVDNDDENESDDDAVVVADDNECNALCGRFFNERSFLGLF
jgi:hypothetical protein